MNLNYRKTFNNTHVKVEIRLPTPKHLDMNEACDVLEAIDTIRKEWTVISGDVNEYLRLEEESCEAALKKESLP